MKPGAIFYNIGRGATVDQEALVAALRSGRLGAAWLDVTDPEPLPPGHPLLRAPNCFITPHTAGGHHNEFEMLARHFLDNFRRFINGAPLRDRVM
jgi:phosphoglycerate dehydrogenase-like enzyme